ncbi:aromatic ring-hydroxylating oxygenase subunit alpha [Granulibacter bethesdensis]|uniref:Rieske [2Fe-2S] domain protein n=1 Tax=Granulibacter bethesdensis (strain ATCC BAA-1260 / CGDNIH1) TaxID=391165 RepID=Q0BUW5_GRABC|nr:aromatic ring-hydroxylating dioxygenase subunit alpha [Granulibacter bethesdensis]ABI61387.1 Rieske [2Fe-2S] domain protein [Granulibacter bethesdensis CGDNIH1]AHJ67509.1 Rieske [2Fe-2S] domain protein [Granulibacter bethesdensis]APH51179.1 Rieske [2Fe-2S] domain protein [Granulibacter bethesdensis]APH63873.1 Rieske [2Fe-2S] domain protein [Granulibacter bethesdensis]
MPDSFERSRPDLFDLRRTGIDPDYWYPLAWSGEIRKGKATGRHFAGEPIVLVRGESGRVYALEDRCAHRQVPLHAGVVEGDCLRCCYHGWTYDMSGRCIDVPYLGKDKLPNGVRAYPCQEKEGLVFIFPGDAARAEMTPLPVLPSISDPAYRTRRFGREVACHYSFMHENLIDMNHQFLHRKQMGQIRPRYLGHDAGEDWLEVRYSFARTAGRQPLGERLIFGTREGKAEPNDSLMTIRTDYPYQGLTIDLKSDRVMQLWIVYVPVDKDQKRIRTFGLLSVKKPRAAFLLHAAWPLLGWFTERIFSEDRWIVEQEQKAHDALGGNMNQEPFPVIRALQDLLARRGRLLSF